MPKTNDIPVAVPDNILTLLQQRKNILIHGRAGTGKSTILRAITAKYPNSVILSPTGIAALNVGGQTIHSFFGLGFGYLQPKDVRACTRHRSVLEKKPLIIIDEVSMVRSDVFTAIDISLRKTLGSQRPFAGLQVVLVGDTGQLPPVVVTNERPFFPNGSAMFFSSLSFSGAMFEHVELTHVYRQTHLGFIEFLTRIRNGSVTQRDLGDFNTRVRTCSTEDSSADNIVLCLTNRAAEDVNTTHYNNIASEEFTYHANVTGAIAERDYPTAGTLKLKCGTKVLMLRNDSEGRWVNGTMAVVSKLRPRQVWVKINNNEYEIDKETWEKFKYDVQGQAIRKVVAGSFEQFPLKMAWAITVHKSQGMTLSKFHLDLSTPPFEHGQLYVALSRAQSLEGITLSRELQISDVKVDRNLLLT